MDNIFDLSELLEDDGSQETPKTEEGKQSLDEIAEMFGIEESQNNSTSVKEIPTTVEQNKKQFQSADEAAKNQNTNKEDKIDPTSLFFDNSKKEENGEEENNKENNEGDNEKNEEELKQKETSASQASTPLKALAKALVSNKVIDAKDEELEKLEKYEDLEDLIKKTIKSSEFSDLNDNQKQYLEALRVGIPEEYIQKHQNIMNQLEQIDEDLIQDNEDLAVSLYSTLLKNKNFSEEKISKYIERAKESNSLYEEANDSLEELKAIQKETFKKETERLQKQHDDNIQRAQKETEEIKEFLTSEKNEVIKGNKLSKKIGEEVYNQMTTSVGTYQDKPINALQKFAIENPVKYKAILNYLFYKGFFTNSIDSKSLATQAKNETIKQFEDILNKEEILSNGDTMKIKNNDEIDAVLNAIDSL